MAEQTRRKPRGRQPITRHPLFPVTAALWCGALLSLAGAVAAPQFGVPMILGLGAIGALGGFFVLRRSLKPKSAVASENAIVPAEGASPLWSELKSQRRALEEEREDPTFSEPAPPAIARAPEILDIASAAGEPLPPEVQFTAEATVASEEIVQPPRRTESAAAARLKQADLEDLSHVELLERLALGLESRRSEPLSAGEAADPAALSGTSHVAALKRSYQALVDLAQQVPPPPAAAPAGPVVFPPQAERRPAPRSQVAATAAAQAYEPAEPGRVSGEPQDPAATEKALREALAALQRMSGTG